MDPFGMMGQVNNFNAQPNRNNLQNQCSYFLKIQILFIYILLIKRWKSKFRRKPEILKETMIFFKNF